MSDEAQFFYDVGKDMAERQGAQIERMAQTILNYRFIVQDLDFADELIEVAEQRLTDDDRKRIG